MPSLMLAAVAGVHLVTAAAFVAVGRRFLSRPVLPGLALPRDAFVAWWWCFAAYLAGEGALALLAAAGWAPFSAFLVFRLVSGPLIAAAAFGLAYHVLFLWSGKAWLAIPIAFYYGGAACAYSLSIWLHGPTGVEVTDWSADLSYVTPMGGGLWQAVLVSMGLPLVLGSLAYLGLAWKVHDRAQRYRIILVASSLLVWVISGYAAESRGGVLVRFVAIVVLGLATAGSVTAAYYPPAAVRRWLAHQSSPSPA
jgi:hypothetical protein